MIELFHKSVFTKNPEFSIMKWLSKLSCFENKSAKSVASFQKHVASQN